MSKHDISDEDKALFRNAVFGITPSAPKKNLNVRETDSREKESVYLSSSFSTQLTGESPIFYCQSSLEKNQLQQFKRGQITLEGTLDLHGYTAEEAKSQLIHFIQSHTQRKSRYLLIIHGKGKHGGGALLKNLVNHWLPQFKEVLAMVSAQPKDGGAGAVYVLLKRNL